MQNSISPVLCHLGEKMDPFRHTIVVGATDLLVPYNRSRHGDGFLVTCNATFLLIQKIYFATRHLDIQVARAICGKGSSMVLFWVREIMEGKKPPNPTDALSSVAQLVSAAYQLDPHHPLTLQAVARAGGVSSVEKTYPTVVFDQHLQVRGDTMPSPLILLARSRSPHTPGKTCYVDACNGRAVYTTHHVDSSGVLLVFERML